MNFMQYVGATMGWLGIGPNMANVLIRLLDDPDVSRGYACGSIADMETAQAMQGANRHGGYKYARIYGGAMKAREAIICLLTLGAGFCLVAMANAGDAPKWLAVVILGLLALYVGCRTRP